MDETARRERIVEELLNCLAPAAVEGVLLQGSMVYGRNFCVTADSDIDLLVVLEPERIYDVAGRGPFAGGIISEWGKRIFADGRADCAWDGFQVDGVVINPGFLSLEFFARWAKLEATSIRRDRSDLPSGMQVGENRAAEWSVDGTPVQYTLSVTQHEDRYTVEKPVFCGDLLVQDMLYGSVLLSEVLVDEGGRIGGLVREFENRVRERYGARGLLNLVDYGLRRASPEFRALYLERVDCREFLGEYERGKEPPIRCG